MAKAALTVPMLIEEAKAFAVSESTHSEPLLFGVTDGKKVGTYIELKFRGILRERYYFEEGSAAGGIVDRPKPF
jgi:hypothetical protein